MKLLAKEKGMPPIEILVNNAGINCQGMPNAVENEYDAVMNTNLKGTFSCYKYLGNI